MSICSSCKFPLQGVLESECKCAWESGGGEKMQTHKHLACKSCYVLSLESFEITCAVSDLHFKAPCMLRHKLKPKLFASVIYFNLKSSFFVFDVNGSASQSGGAAGGNCENPERNMSTAFQFASRLWPEEREKKSSPLWTKIVFLLTQALFI